MAAASLSTASSDRTPSCSLEALNTDIIFEILSTCNSLADLSAFIHASPIIYNSFFLAKSAILRSVITNELGPTIRDAAILAHTDRFDGDDFENRLKSAVGEYRRQRLLPDDSEALWRWLAGLHVDTVVRMAALTRAVFYFVDLYESFRMPYFKQTLDPPCDWSMSRTERRRIAQALLRFQIMANMNGGRLWQPSGSKREFFLVTVLPLFQPWELEQASEMDHFLASLCGALIHCEKTMSGETIHPSFQRQDYYFNRYCNLEAFRAKLVEATDRDRELLGRLKANPVVCSGKMGRESLFEWLAASHRYQEPPSDDYPPVTRYLDGMKLTDDGPAQAPGFKDDSPTGPPWAWVDAFNGRTTDRWGVDLVPERPPHNDLWEEHMEMEELLKSWRWLGLMFWDRDRAEELLKNKILEPCTSGWLALYEARCARDNAGTESP